MSSEFLDMLRRIEGGEAVTMLKIVGRLRRQKTSVVLTIDGEDTPFWEQLCGEYSVLTPVDGEKEVYLAKRVAVPPMRPEGRAFGPVAGGDTTR